MGRRKGGRVCETGKEFVFRLPNGNIVGKARSVGELAALIKQAPLQSILFHANGRHFSPWLKMLGKKTLAKRLGKIKGDAEEVRKRLLELVG